MEPELITSMTSQRGMPLSSQQGGPLQDLEAESPAPPPYLAPPPYPDPADMIGLAGCDIPPQGPPLYLASCNITHMAPPPCDVTFLAPPPAPPLHMEEQEAPLDLSMSSQDRVTDEALDLSRRTCRSSTHRAPSVWTMPAAPDLGSKPMSLSVPDPGSLPVPIVGGGPLEGFLSRLCCQHQRLLLGLLRYATNSRAAIAAAGGGPAVVRQTIGTAEEPGPAPGSSREPTADLVMTPALGWGPSGLAGLAGGPTCDGGVAARLCEEDSGGRATAPFGVNGGGAAPIHFQTPGQPPWLPVQAVQPLRARQADAGGASEAGARPVDPPPAPSSFPGGVGEAEEGEGAAGVVEGPAATTEEDGAEGSTAPGKRSPKKRKKKSRRRTAAVTVAGEGTEARAGGLGRGAGTGTARKSLAPGCARTTSSMPHLLLQQQQQRQQRHRRRHRHHHRRCGYERPSSSEAAQCDVVYVSRPVDPHGDGAGESAENAAGSGNDGADGDDGAAAAALADAGVSVAAPAPAPVPAPPLSPVRCYGKRSARKSTRGHVSGAGGTWEVHTVRVARAALIGVPDVGRRRALSDNNSRSLPNNAGAGTGTGGHHRRRTPPASCRDADGALFPAAGERHQAPSENEPGGGGGGEISKTAVPPVPGGPSEDDVVRVEDGARVARPPPRAERGARARMRSWRGLRAGAGAATNARKTARGSGLVGASAEIAASPSARAPPASSCQMVPPERLAAAAVVAGPSMPAAELTATDGDGISPSFLDRAAPPTPPPPAAAALAPTAESGEPSHLPSTDSLADANRSPVPPASPAVKEESAPLVRAGTEVKREEEERRRRGGDAAPPPTPEAAPSSSLGAGAGRGPRGDAAWRPPAMVPKLPRPPSPPSSWLEEDEANAAAGAVAFTRASVGGNGAEAAALRARGRRRRREPASPHDKRKKCRRNELQLLSMADTRNGRVWRDFLDSVETVAAVPAPRPDADIVRAARGRRHDSGEAGGGVGETVAAKRSVGGPPSPPASPVPNDDSDEDAGTRGDFSSDEEEEEFEDDYDELGDYDEDDEEEDVEALLARWIPADCARRLRALTERYHNMAAGWVTAPAHPPSASRTHGSGAEAEREPSTATPPSHATGACTRGDGDTGAAASGAVDGAASGLPCVNGACEASGAGASVGSECGAIVDGACGAIVDGACGAIVDGACGAIVDGACGAIVDGACGAIVDGACGAIVDGACGAIVDGACGAIVDGACGAIVDGACGAIVDGACGAIVDGACGAIVDGACDDDADDDDPACGASDSGGTSAASSAGSSCGVDGVVWSTRGPGAVRLLFSRPLRVSDVRRWFLEPTTTTTAAGGGSSGSTGSSARPSGTGAETATARPDRGAKGGSARRHRGPRGSARAPRRPRRDEGPGSPRRRPAGARVGADDRVGKHLKKFADNEPTCRAGAAAVPAVRGGTGSDGGGDVAANRGGDIPTVGPTEMRRTRRAPANAGVVVVTGIREGLRGAETAAPKRREMPAKAVETAVPAAARGGIGGVIGGSIRVDDDRQTVQSAGPAMATRHAGRNASPGGERMARARAHGAVEEADTVRRGAPGAGLVRRCGKPGGDRGVGGGGGVGDGGTKTQRGDTAKTARDAEKATRHAGGRQHGWEIVEPSGECEASPRRLTRKRKAEEEMLAAHAGRAVLRRGR
ncbi:mucin-19-like [Lethenteron reissneri]|uniref:mucin-19-like n=1 Tax=Lethenteron reissneri TaxID=7753 RepID=UPI002AB695B6|nr:mucin-19-like [Lethenteron reissneri]